MLKFIIFGLLLFLLFLNSCVTLKESDKPGYIQVENAKVLFNGEARDANIKDIWVFQTPSFQGVYQIPVNFPVLNRDNSEFLIKGGVWANDNPTQKKMYPFWQFDTLQKKLSSVEKVVHNPVFKYFPSKDLIIPFSENFEGNQIQFINLHYLKDTALIARSESKFDGNYSGYIKFDSTHRNFWVVSGGPAFELPQDQEIWAEVTYKGNVKFSISLRDDFINIPTLPPNKDEWKTVYFDLSDQLRASAGTKNFKLYLRTVTDGSELELYFDNIRLLRFAP